MRLDLKYTCLVLTREHQLSFSFTASFNHKKLTTRSDYYTYVC